MVIFNISFDDIIDKKIEEIKRTYQKMTIDKKLSESQKIYKETKEMYLKIKECYKKCEEIYKQMEDIRKELENKGLI
jgi:predicted nucleotide-binding protein (sugar kinase/HSP70/actin superfamily)